MVKFKVTFRKGDIKTVINDLIDQVCEEEDEKIPEINQDETSCSSTDEFDGQAS